MPSRLAVMSQDPSFLSILPPKLSDDPTAAMPHAIGDSSISGGGLLLVIALACWCWLGAGPRCFRWPLLVLLALLTSGHWTGSLAGEYLDAVAGPLLVLLIMAVGFSIMLRGFWPRQPRTHRQCCRERGWNRDR